ncbi:MAG: hypothetical protein ACRDIA_08520 [Actinomycetota bacterium]
MLNSNHNPPAGYDAGLRLVPVPEPLPLFQSRQIRIPASGPERSEALNCIFEALASDLYRQLEEDGRASADRFADWCCARLLRTFAQVREAAA